MKNDTTGKFILKSVFKNGSWNIIRSSRVSISYREVATNWVHLFDGEHWVPTEGMMITVNVWPFRGKNVAYGHASVLIEGGEPAGTVYISWWPQGAGRAFKKRGKNLYCVASIRDRTFTDDVTGEEGNQPLTVIKLDGSSDTSVGLNETAMKKWWLDLVRSGSTDWCTLTANCSTISSYALKQGGGDDFCDSFWYSHNAVWIPNDVAVYAGRIASGLQDAKSGPRPGADGTGDAGAPGGISY